MAELSPGKPAKCKYRPVRFSHIFVEPHEMAVLTADPWSFLHSYLLQKKTKSAGENRKGYERARYYSKLAEDFYKASESSDIPTKGTLLYYGMMNLVKAFLSVKKVKLEDIPEHHGLTNTHGRKYSLTVSGKMKGCTNIFLEFARLLSAPVLGKHEINLRHILPHIPELHAIANNSGIVKKPKMLPVNIQFLVNENNTYLFTEISFDKSTEHTIDTSKFYKGKRKEYFKSGAPSAGKVVYRSKARKKLTPNNWSRVYKNILKEYEGMGLSSVLTRSGYRYYCPMQDAQYHHLCYTYLFMFYLGHSARYRPTEITEILEGELRAVVAEAAALCPRQFMYQLVSLITNKLCVIPYASI
jgi:hypothetical protein